jgi:hypothetical protein
MVARAVVSIPTVLCLWISEIIASLPGRCAVTVLELLTGTLLTGYGSISQAILAVPCRRHWTSYYWMVRKGKFDWKAMVHALCRIVKREFPSERCIVVGDDTLIPRVSEAAPGAAIQYDHARKPNRPDYILAQTVVSLSAVIGNSLGSWSVPLMSNLAVRTGNHGKLETMRAMVEEVSATLGAITLLLDAWYMKGYLISDVLTRDTIVIGQATPPCMICRHSGRENQGGPESTATASRRRSSTRFHKRARSCRSTAAIAPFAIAPPSAWSASSAVVLSEWFGYRCSSMANGKRNGFCYQLIGATRQKT